MSSSATPSETPPAASAARARDLRFRPSGAAFAAPSVNVALLAIGVAGTAIVAFTVVTREPSERLSVALVLIGIALAAGAFAARALMWASTRGKRRNQRVAAVGPALRRGAAIGAVVGTLALLRVVDGLTPITAGFVVLAFALAEVALSARTT